MMSYSERISDIELRLAILEHIRSGGQYRLSDFMPLFLEYLGYGWSRAYGRVRVAENLIQMHRSAWIEIDEISSQSDPWSIDLTPEVDFRFRITAEGLAVLGQNQARTTERRKKSTEVQSIAALVSQHKYPKSRNEKTAKERIAKAIATRRGQQEFRQKLLDTYKRCLVTGCDAEDALEAAHIRSYAGGGTFDLSNGLLLRADIHTLFDLGLIAVDSKTMTVIVAPALENTYYDRFDGKRLRFPKECTKRPDKVALKEHREEAGFN